MAHWIKIEVITPDKLEMRRIARLCNCSIADAFLAFFRFYSWADEVTDTGHIPALTAEDIDHYAERPGFGSALADVGWISFSDAGGTISNWDRHNGESAKKRCISAERKRLWRENSDEKP